jgi:hypothetical protein
MERPKPSRAVMSLAGAIPAVSIAAGLLSLSPESALRQEYWPWLPLATLAVGMAFSLFFWFVLAPRRKRKD